jgi:hypothetical protein
VGNRKQQIWYSGDRKQQEAGRSRHLVRELVLGVHQVQLGLDGGEARGLEARLTHQE